MNLKTWLLLLVALLAGCAVAYGVKSAFFVERAETPSDVALGAKETLLVANGAIEVGDELNAQNVRLQLIPEKSLPRDGLFTFGDVVGRKVARAFQDGEPIALYDLQEVDNSQSGSSVFVPPGYSIVPIEICSASKSYGSRNYLKTMSLDKIVEVGDTVDFIVVKEELGEIDPNLGSTRRKLVSRPVASDVSIFAINESNRSDLSATNRISILSALLSSEQLEAVRKASDSGKLKIALHNSSVEVDFDASSGLDFSQTEDSVPQNMGFELAAFDEDDDNVISSSDEKGEELVEDNFVDSTVNYESKNDSSEDSAWTEIDSGQNEEAEDSVIKDSREIDVLGDDRTNEVPLDDSSNTTVTSDDGSVWN